ncbi:hypothetical protein ACF2G4_22490 (plasmid) [Pantoea sp. C3]
MNILSETINRVKPSASNAASQRARDMKAQGLDKPGNPEKGR